MCFGCVDAAVQSGEFANFKTIESVLLAPARLRGKIVQANDMAVEAVVFLGFSDMRHLGHGVVCPVSFVSMVAGRRHRGAMLRDQRSDLSALVVVSLC
jgi:hypothetical protein